MQKNNTILRIFALLLLISFVAGCKKNDEAKPATEEDFASAQATLDVVAEVESLNDLSVDIFQDYNSDLKLSEARVARSKESVCGNYSSAYVKGVGYVLTIDFGSGQTCEDSVTRKGKIIYTFDTNGTSVSAKFEGYEADGKKLSGDYSVAVTYPENTIAYDFQFKNAVLTYADASTVKWSSAYKMNWKLIESQTQGFVLEMETSGGISGTNKDGKSFSATITTPLFITSTCEYGLTKGVYLIKAQGHPDATYDFGNGSCDDVVTLTILGQTKTFSVANSAE